MGATVSVLEEAGLVSGAPVTMLDPKTGLIVIERA
jgi:hypothetical protein